MDELSDAHANVLKDMTPGLAALYKVQGDWQRIVSIVMQLPPSMPILIRQLWVERKEIARKKGAPLTPQHFAEMFVDQYLVK